jgi:hypothetical protein
LKLVASNVKIIRAATGKLSEDAPTVSSAAALQQRLRAHARIELHDSSRAPPEGLAIYTLSDPRDIRAARYVGQTSSPRRRFMQHLNQARLWLPDELPWWVRQPKLRPLYSWIRALYREEGRLPIMVVLSWSPTVVQARAAERACIIKYLALQGSLLNVESLTLQTRPLLL